MRFPPCLLPFGPAPPTSAGRSSLPATPLRKCKNAKGRPPLAPASRLPNLPRFACADLRCATPFPLPLRSRCKGGDTPRLAVATPRLRQEAFGMYMPRFNADVQELEHKESNHEHRNHRRPVQRHTLRPKPQNAAAKATDSERGNRS